MTHDPAAHKRRRGLARWRHAFGFSCAGLRAAWGEAAFRAEALAAGVLLPTAFWLGRTWAEQALLLGSVLAVLVVELLNTAIEAVVDRAGTEWNALAKRAKDLGSAAVLLAVLGCAATWGLAIWARSGAAP